MIPIESSAPLISSLTRVLLIGSTRIGLNRFQSRELNYMQPLGENKFGVLHEERRVEAGLRSHHSSLF